MEKPIKQVKKTIGSALEVRFLPEGYRFVWDHRIRMTPAELRFFCDYYKDKWLALLYAGVVPPPEFAKCSSSLRTLHSMAVNFLHTAAACKTVVELKEKIEQKVNELAVKLDNNSKLPIEAIKEIYRNLIQKVQDIAGDSELSSAIQRLFTIQLAAINVHFSLVEVEGNAQNPFELLVTCYYKGNDVPLSEAIRLLGNDEAAFLSVTSVLQRLSKKSQLVARLLTENFVLDSIPLTQKDMYTFLKELELYDSMGVGCRVPNRWKKHRTAMTLGIAMCRQPAELGSDELIDFDINLSIDGEKLSDEEIQALLRNDSELFLFRGRWVELKRNEMRSCLLAYESILAKQEEGNFALVEAMRAFLSPETIVDDEEFVAPDVVFDNEQWLASINESLCHDERLMDISRPSDTFTAVLRPYQIAGVNWLNTMRKIGLGACLSDDMGLGKTVQVIAVLEQLRLIGAGPSLIVIPASLLQNWQDELVKFAPCIKYRILHSSYGSMNISAVEDTNVFITTYAMLSRLPQVKKKQWECVILDEAQAIKNPRTLQSKAAKQLTARFRVAMTGTPIENSAADLWSIFGFLNPQFAALEGLAEDEDPEVMNEKLKSFVRPFILRRLKTDKSIISDLPEKIEMKNYCHLTQHQAVLYKQITNALCDDLTEAHGIERRGLVLATILKLKKICNHPDQYTGHGAYVQSESGKLSRLVELCEDIKRRKERVLVFTQFKEMCEPLNSVLRDVFGTEGLVIHGSVSVSERGDIVDRFNNPDEYIPYIVLSLRAGGVGLNLVAANHVIHFDRWWNPAVENQATDRAFRIGQKKNVIVHKMICTGTLEEKIDKMIERKSSMALEFVENSLDISNMSNEEIMALLHMEA